MVPQKQKKGGKENKPRELTPSQVRENILKQCREECPSSVVEIVEYLAGTGTGNSKLEQLAKIGKSSESIKGFLADVGQEDKLNEGTLLKIEKFLETKSKAKSEEVKVPEESKEKKK